MVFFLEPWKSLLEEIPALERAVKLRSMTTEEQNMMPDEEGGTKQNK